MSLEVFYPAAAIVYDRGSLVRKIIPGFGESALFDLRGTEGSLFLYAPPYDDATCQVAITSIFGAVVPQVVSQNVNLGSSARRP